MNDEEKRKLEIQLWTRTIATQEHFNQMILSVRNHLLTLVTAVSGASALIYTKGIMISVCCVSVNVASFLLLSGIFLVVAFYVTEKGYYQLLIGAVKHAAEIEKAILPDLPAIGLAHRITQESGTPILFLTMRSVSRMRFFYLVLCLMLTVAALVASCKTSQQVSIDIAPAAKVAAVAPASAAAGVDAVPKH